MTILTIFCSDASSDVCSVEFFLPRNQFRAMTYATNTIDLGVIFPKVIPESWKSLSQTPQLQCCLQQISQLQLYGDQKQALEGMLHPELKQVK